MVNKLSIRFLYGVSHQVFNVDSNDSKMHYDPITSLKYVYASSNNVKHNLRKEFVDIWNDTQENSIEPLKKVFYSTESEKKQAEVEIKMDIENPILALFGAWNSCQTDVKYSQSAAKSCFNISQFSPIHIFLSKKAKTVGIHSGDCNSVNGIKTKDNKNNSHYYTTPEELAETTSYTAETAKEKFEQLRALNFFEEKTTANGLYHYDIHIDLDVFGKINLTTFTLTEEDKAKYLANGWEEQTIRGEKYLSKSKEYNQKLFELFIKALFSWDFTSNNSLHGSEKELLRVSCALNDTLRWQQATMAKVVDEEERKAELVLNDEVSNVYSFNTNLLSKYYMTESNGIKTDINADILAQEKLIELGKSKIK